MFTLPAPGRRTNESPRAYRLFTLTLSCLVFLTQPALATAQTDLSADEAVLAALTQLHIEERIPAGTANLRADVLVATGIPNPTLQISHEEIPGDHVTAHREFSLLLEQRFDLTRWRKRLRDTLPLRESALRSEFEGWRIEVAADVREAFYKIRYHEERLAALDSWIVRLERSLQGVRARQIHGDTSNYQILRVERELELAKARQATESAFAAEAWEALERWLTWEARPRLVGDLTPASRSDDSNTTHLRPDLTRLLYRKRTFEAETKVWGSLFLRDWTFGAGYRLSESDANVGHGFLLTLSLPIPLRNVDTPRLKKLQAQLVEATIEYELRKALAQREVAAARKRLDDTLQALEAMSNASDDELSRLAQLAFDAGEASLAELLDAFESQRDLRLARLDLEWAARRASIALDHTLGLGAPR